MDANEDTPRERPVDLLVVVTLAVLSCVAVFVSDSVAVSGPIMMSARAILGVVLVLFLPGYALVAALFPRRAGWESSDSESAAPPTETRGIDTLERVVLSIAVSVSTVVLATTVVAVSPSGFRPAPVTLVVVGITLLAALVAEYRRRRLLPAERYRSPLVDWVRRGVNSVRVESSVDGALNLLVLVTVLLAAGSVVYTVTADDPSATTFYLLTEADDGELVAEDYPRNLTVNESIPLVVGIDNDEPTATDYTVVVELQDVDTTANGTRVVWERELDAFPVTVLGNETRLIEHIVRPTTPGEDLRLTYLLYANGTPADSTTENAYRETHLWVNVTARSTG